MISNFPRSCEYKSTPLASNFVFADGLDILIEALEAFQDFQPSIKRVAIALYSSELAAQYGWQQETAELHLYLIALYAGLEVALESNIKRGNG